METVEAIASALEALFERVNEIVAISQWQTSECEATVATLLGHMTAAVHMGCLTPPPCLLECKHHSTDSLDSCVCCIRCQLDGRRRAAVLWTGHLAMWSHTDRNGRVGELLLANQQGGS